ncbi:MAG: hypothetical protein H6806_05730 [Planctomycetes bacterium]|nr:hypothetical protein [Planctomycetota bacterium]MCB9829242.1 hypothetical protein [Planctomycetota bacterium]MCB9902590.1 hypothetical protein [Planctomycetota bacterium]
MPVLVGIVIAIPLLYVMAVALFADDLSPLRADHVELGIAGMALALVWFGLAGDTMAAEVAGGGPHLARRQAGAMLPLFLAKLVVLGGLAVSVAWYAQYAFVWAWHATSSLPMPDVESRGEYRWLVGELAFDARLARGLNVGLAWSWVAIPLLSWVLVAGSWIARSGAASLAGLLLVGAVAGPFLLGMDVAPWLVGWFGEQGLRNIAYVVGGLGCVTALVSWLVGWSRQRRVLVPALAGGTVVLFVLGSMGAWAYADWRTWSVIEPTDPELRIQDARVGADGTSLWLVVHKGVAYADGLPVEYLHGRPQGAEEARSMRGTPIQMWRVDLTTRGIAVVANGGERQFVGEGLAGTRWGGWAHRGPRVPLPFVALVAPRAMPADSVTVEWYDTRTPQEVAVLPWGCRDGRIDRLLQAGLRDLAPQRDADGRRVWIRDGELEREGSERAPRNRVEQLELEDLYRCEPVPGGWWRSGGPVEATTRRGDLDFLHLDGSASPIATTVQHERHSLSVLDAEHVALRMSTSDEPRWMQPLQILRTATGEEVSRVRPPGLCASVGVAARLLLVRSQSGPAPLSLWSPGGGDELPLRWQGLPLTLAEGEVCGLYTMQRHPQGHVLVKAFVYAPEDRRAGTVEVSLVVDPKALTVRQVLAQAQSLDFSRELVALDADGSLIMLEDDRRIVRHGPELGQHEVLFPFPEK